MLKYRLVSGTLLVVGFGGMLWWQHWLAPLLFALVMCGLLILALREHFALTAAIELPGYAGFTTFVGVMHYLGLTGIAISSCSHHLKLTCSHLLEVGLFTSYLIFLCLEAFSERDFEFGVKKAVVSIAAYGFYVITFSALLKLVYIHSTQPAYASGTGQLGVIFLILVTKAADIGGYVAGRTTALLPGGNHKMTPRLSPNKSWEGLAGGAVFCVATALLLYHLLGEKTIDVSGRPWLTPTSAVILGIVFTLAGLVGDLSISLLKRAAGVKDTGVTFPGMGGVLDVIDSLIFIPPLFYAYLLLSAAV